MRRKWLGSTCDCFTSLSYQVLQQSWHRARQAPETVYSCLSQLTVAKADTIIPRLYRILETFKILISNFLSILEKYLCKVSYTKSKLSRVKDTPKSILSKMQTNSNSILSRVTNAFATLLMPFKRITSGVISL